MISVVSFPPTKTAPISVLWGLALLACGPSQQPGTSAPADDTKESAVIPKKATADGTGDSTMKKVAFAPIVEDTLPTSLQGLTVELAVEPEQSLDGAVALSVRLENKGSADASILNPYDLLSYQINNGEGWPIGTTAPPSRIKTGRVMDRSGYLRITDIQVNGESEKDIDAQVALNVLVLPPSTSYVYRLRIENVVAPKDKDGPTTIVPGNYTVKCVVLLNSTIDEDPRGAVMESERLAVSVQ